MQDPEIKIEYHWMDIKGFKDDLFVVAKLRRISSSPVRVGTVRDAKANALERLVDIFRCGDVSRNYADFTEVKKNTDVFGPVDAKSEWAAYTEELCRVKGLERLESLQLTTPKWRDDRSASRFRVKYRDGMMNDNPYIVATVGDIMASPAAIWLTYPHVRESAVDRLYDVFRIGTQGQIFKDLLEYRRKAGWTQEQLYAEWDACEGAVLRELEYGREPWRAPEEVKAEWNLCEKAVLQARELAHDMARLLKSDRRHTT